MKDQVKKFGQYIKEQRDPMPRRGGMFIFKEKDSTEFAGKASYETEPQYALERIATNEYGKILIYQNVGDGNIAGLSRKNIQSTYDFGMVLDGETVIEIEGLSEADVNYLFDLFVA